MSWIQKTALKLKTELRTNWIFYLIFVLLLILPFLWFSKHLYILGDDDTGLSYYNPLGMLKTALSTWYSLDHIARFEESVGHQIVFSSVLQLIKIVTFNLVNIDQLAFGIIMSFSFFYIVKTLELLHNNKPSLAFYFAGLFFAISPNFIFTEYYYLLPSTFAILLCPAVLYHLLKAYKTRSIRPLFISAVWTFILSRAIITPFFINFFAFLTVFYFLYVFFTDGFKQVLTAAKYLIISVLLITLINSMILVPIIYSSSQKGSSALEDSVINRNEPSYIDNMLSYIQQEVRLNRVNYYLNNIYPEPIINLQGFRSSDFYPAYIDKTYLLMYIITFAMLAGLLFSAQKKKILIPVLLLYITTLLFMSVNILDSFKQFYFFLMTHTPVFNMNRVPSMKFNLPFIFYGSLLLGISLDSLFKKFPKWKNVVFLLCLLALCANSFILITGKLFTQKLPPLDTVRAMDFNKDYKQLTKDFRAYIHDDARLVLFPLGYGFGSFIAGEDPSQYYRSTVTGFKSFTGYDMFGTIRNFDIVLDKDYLTKANDYYFSHNLADFYQLAQDLNIKYVVYTKNLAPLKKFGELVPTSTYNSPDYYSVADTSHVVYENAGYKIYRLKTYNDTSKFTADKKTTDLSFSRVSDFIYLLKVKTDGTDFIKFRESYSSKWNLYQISPNDFNCLEGHNYATSFPNITECAHPMDNITGIKELVSLKKEPYLQTNHFQYGTFANGWKIKSDKDYIYFALVFDGESSLFLGLGVSFGVLLVCIVAYCILGIKKRSTKK